MITADSQQIVLALSRLLLDFNLGVPLCLQRLYLLYQLSLWKLGYMEFPDCL